MTRLISESITRLVLTAKDQETCICAKEKLQVLKTGSIVTAIAKVFFLVVFPSLLSVAFTMITLITCHDLSRIADNAINILNNPMKKFVALDLDKDFKNDLGKNTVVLGQLLKSTSKKVTFDQIMSIGSPEFF